jgi:hypothetical protein
LHGGNSYEDQLFMRFPDRRENGEAREKQKKESFRPIQTAETPSLWLRERSGSGFRGLAVLFFGHVRIMLHTEGGCHAES